MCPILFFTVDSTTHMCRRLISPIELQYMALAEKTLSQIVHLEAAPKNYWALGRNSIYNYRWQVQRETSTQHRQTLSEFNTVS